MEGGKGHKRKGLWTEEEDRILMEHISLHGRGRWNRVAKMTGLKRSGKSCRLRWMNYLNPTIKHGDFSDEEDELVIRLHNLLGNRWSLIAGRIPGRTDNQVKNHWNTHLSKKLGVKNVKSSSIRAYLAEETNSGEPVNNGNQKTGENGSGSSIRSFDLIDPVASGGGENLFWFSNDEIALNTDGLTGLFDQYCSDPIWNQF